MKITLHTQEIEVPDGKWVYETYSSWGWKGNCRLEFDKWEYGSKVVGLRKGEFVRYEDAVHLSYTKVLYVADKPFGVLLWETVNDGETLALRFFYCARQVHKGELGRYPQIPMPQHVLQHKLDGKKEKLAWVRLTDLASHVGMTPEEVFLRYVEFAKSSRMGHHCLDYVTARSKQEIASGEPKVKHIFWYYLEELQKLNPRRVWVPRGWANIVTSMVHFGAKPFVRCLDLKDAD